MHNKYGTSLQNLSISCTTYRRIVYLVVNQAIIIVVVINNNKFVLVVFAGERE